MPSTANRYTSNMSAHQSTTDDGRKSAPRDILAPPAAPAPQEATPAPPRINPLLPLSSHYSLLNKTILPAFASSLAQQSYSIAYAVGVQFVEMALVSIPSHGYFDRDASAAGVTAAADSDRTTSNTASCERERRRSVRDAVRVAKILEDMVEGEQIVDDEQDRVEEARRLKALADEAARTTFKMHGGGKSTNGDDDGSWDWASIGTDASSERSVWEWVAGSLERADGVCEKFVNEICMPSAMNNREKGRPHHIHHEQVEHEERIVRPSNNSSKNGVSTVLETRAKSDGNGDKYQADAETEAHAPEVAASVAYDAAIAAALSSDWENQQQQKKQRHKKKKSKQRHKKKKSKSEQHGVDMQFEQDLERALYLSGLDAAKVESLKDAADEERRRKERQQEQKRKRGEQRRTTKSDATGGPTITDDDDVRPRPDGPPRPEGPNSESRRYGKKKIGTVDQQEEEDGVLILRQASGTTDGGRDGPEEFLPSPPCLSPIHSMDTFDSISAMYREDFHALRTAGRIRVYPLATVQGRVAGSINGCTVIAPLLAVTHLQNLNDINDDKVNGNDINMLDDMDWETNWETISSSSSDAAMHLEAIDDDHVGVPDSTIEEIIDERAPMILPSIRSKLNLKGNALIIPSDVHDYLIDAGLLRQDQFVGVAGGNILDDNHLVSFLQTLESDNVGTAEAAETGQNNEPSSCRRRIAATLFFHAHVVCLHRLVVKRKKRMLKECGNGGEKKRMFRRRRDKPTTEELVEVDEIWFDFIDSLPVARMLPAAFSSRCASRSTSRSIRSYDEIDRVGSTASGRAPVPELRRDSSSYIIEDESRDAFEGTAAAESGWADKAVRIRCSDAESLTAMLRWYAYSKFSDKDRAHITHCPWDDHNPDFDPRVFQAFVWGE